MPSHQLHPQSGIDCQQDSWIKTLGTFKRALKTYLFDLPNIVIVLFLNDHLLSCFLCYRSDIIYWLSCVPRSLLMFLPDFALFPLFCWILWVLLTSGTQTVFIMFVCFVHNEVFNHSCLHILCLIVVYGIVTFQIMDVSCFLTTPSGLDMIFINFGPRIHCCVYLEKENKVEIYETMFLLLSNIYNPWFSYIMYHWNIFIFLSKPY